MTSYSEMVKNYRAKAKQANLSEVDYALADLKQVLALHRDAPHADLYVTEKLIEWDAYLDRKHELTKE